MENLLNETLSIMDNHNLKVSDIIFIGSADAEFSCSWTRFFDLANKLYHDGFGSSEVATDLVIVFTDNSKLVRMEYYGSEWWQYNRVDIDYSKNGKTINNLFTKNFESSLKEINN